MSDFTRFLSRVTRENEHNEKCPCEGEKEDKITRGAVVSEF